MARIQRQPEFADSDLTVKYNLTVNEGKQFRMEKLTLNGMSPDEAKRVESAWKLSEGSVFDLSYVEDFINKPLAGRASSRSGQRIQVDLKPDKERQTVDVAITRKD